jgi:spermidine/putrescine transport system ATP-binding protein
MTDAAALVGTGVRPFVAEAGRAGSAELEGVTKRFGATTAVDDLSLMIEAGEFLSLLGPSGCGKTTSLRLLAGFEHPDTGVIRVAGNDVAGVPPYRRDVNTVFQHYALFPHLTVSENVAFGLRQRKVGREETRTRVWQALEMVRMSHLTYRRPRQLSGGQQQRVALARALVNRPALLLLDEPLGALDRKLRQEMQIELKLLQAEVGTTFVYVTHDQEEALSMSDRIAVMLDGRIQQLADPDEIYDDPATAFVAGFIGTQNFLPGTARGDGHVVEGDGFGVRGGRQRDGVVSGRDAVAAVRPEAVDVLADDPGPGHNVVAGTLAGVSHLGDVLQYVVVGPGGREVLSRKPRLQAERLEAGTQVWCTWPVDAMTVFGTEQRSSG